MELVDRSLGVHTRGRLTFLVVRHDGVCREVDGVLLLLLQGGLDYEILCKTLVDNS